MSVIPPVHVKISCVTNLEDALLALEFGASAIGFVCGMSNRQGEVAPHTIASIVAALPQGVGTFLLTSGTDVDQLVERQRVSGTNTLQLWDSLYPGDYERLRRELPGVSVVQAVHVRGRDALDDARFASRRVDAIVLDSGVRTVPDLSHGGPTHDWEISREIVEALDVPAFLAGGLTPGNVGDAISLVRPYGVDVCTGVRSADRLDRSKLVAFFEAVQRISP